MLWLNDSDATSPKGIPGRGNAQKMTCFFPCLLEVGLIP